MGKEFLKFCDVGTEKQNFHSSKSLIDENDVNIDEIVTSDEFPCTKKGSKYFVGYRNKEEVTTLCLAPKNEGMCKKF